MELTMTLQVQVMLNPPIHPQMDRSHMLAQEANQTQDDKLRSLMKVPAYWGNWTAF